MTATPCFNHADKYRDGCVDCHWTTQRVAEASRALAADHATLGLRQAVIDAAIAWYRAIEGPSKAETETAEANLIDAIEDLGRQTSSGAPGGDPSVEEEAHGRSLLTPSGSAALTSEPGSTATPATQAGRDLAEKARSIHWSTRKVCDLVPDAILAIEREASASATALREAVAALHPKVEHPTHGCCAEPKVCKGHQPECGGRDHGMSRPLWPCATMRALAVAAGSDDR